MKRRMILWMAAMLCAVVCAVAGSALAEMEQPTYTQGTVPLVTPEPVLNLIPAQDEQTPSLDVPAVLTRDTALLSRPGVQGDTLMEYFRGVEVEIVRGVDAQYVQVNVGAQGGSLMGYMRMDDLDLSDPDIRNWVRMASGGQLCRVYSYPDAQSPELTEDFPIDRAQVLGQNDGWLHVRVSGERTGFVSKEGLESAIQVNTDEPYLIVEPLENELSTQDAVAIATQLLLEDAERGINDNMGMGELTQEILDACRAEVEIIVYLEEPDRMLYQLSYYQEGRDNIYAYIYLWVRGQTVESYNYGNG